MADLLSYLYRISGCCGAALVLGFLSLLPMLAVLRVVWRILDRLYQEHEFKPPVWVRLSYGAAVAIGLVVFAGTFCLLLWLLETLGDWPNH